MLAYEQASLALAQRCSGVGGATPLFTAMLNYRHSTPRAQSGVSDPEQGGIVVISARERTNYPFGISVDDLGTGFSVEAQIDVSVCALRVIAYLETALEGLVAALEGDAQMAVLALPVLPQAELRELHALNATQAPFAHDRCLHALFEAQAASTPDNIALVCEDGSVSYAASTRAPTGWRITCAALGVGPTAGRLVRRAQAGHDRRPAGRS